MRKPIELAFGAKQSQLIVNKDRRDSCVRWIDRPRFRGIQYRLATYGGCGGVYNTGAQEEQQIIITIMRLNRDVGRRWETIGNCGGKCPRKQRDNVDHERGVSK